MKPQSAKAKGRNLQKLVVSKILELFPWLKEDDVNSRSMGAGGEDILLSPFARKSLPLSFECKNTERINLWNAYDQAKSNSKGFESVLVVKRNRMHPLAVVSLDYFLNLHRVEHE